MKESDGIDLVDWFELDTWILIKKKNDSDWEIPENTLTFKKGIDAVDIKQLLSLQLGLKLKIVVEV